MTWTSESPLVAKRAVRPHLTTHLLSHIKRLFGESHHGALVTKERLDSAKDLIIQNNEEGSNVIKSELNGGVKDDQRFKASTRRRD